MIGLGKNNANYFLVNDGVPLYIKQGNSYGNSMPDIALMDKYTLGVGPNLMPDLTLYNPLRIIDSRKKFYIVKYPRKSNKSNIYSPIIYNQLNKEGREIVDEYIKLLDMKLDKTIDPLKVESSYTSFTSILVKAINNLPASINPRI